MPSKSSQRWLSEHFSDQYVKRAKVQGYRSRAAFKLKEIQEKDKLFQSNMLVIDLGAAPGSWSQVVLEHIKPKGTIIALDILPMDPIEGVNFIQGDFTEEAVCNQLRDQLAGKQADWVLSDMAPNLSGINSVDQAKSILLVELALELAKKVVASHGGILFKVFQGEGFDQFLKEIKSIFKKVTIRKPKASRGRSNEVYILARLR